MKRLSALLLTIVITLTTSLTLPVQKIFAEERGCAGALKTILYVDAPRYVETLSPSGHNPTFDINIYFDQGTVDLSTRYVIYLPAGGDVTRSNPNRVEFTLTGAPTVTVKGKGALQATVKMPTLTQPNTSQIIIYPGTFSSTTCSAGEIGFNDYQLSRATCGVKIPENIHLGDNPKPEVRVAGGLADIQYDVFVYERSKTTQLLTFPFHNRTVSPPQRLDYNQRSAGPIRVTTPLPGVNNVDLGLDKLKIGDYALVVSGEKRINKFLQDDVYNLYCKVAPFSVTNNATTAPKDYPPTAVVTPGSPGYTGSTGGATGAGQACAEGYAGVLTAIGCVPVDPTVLINQGLKVGTGLAGAVALLMLISGTFTMMTSAGNPATLKKGSDQASSAIIGLLFVIFSILLLQVIGVDLLNLPGFRR